MAIKTLIRPKKILLAGGCSYTDPNFKSFDTDLPESRRGGWPMWPELMAKELGLECINTGGSGRGCDHIFNSIMTELAKYGNRVDTIAILWPGSDRASFYTYTFNPLVEIAPQTEWEYPDGRKINPFYWMDSIGIGRPNQNYWNSDNFNKKTYYYMIDNMFSKYMAIIEICKANNIKLIMAQGLRFLDCNIIKTKYENGTLKKNAYISQTEVYGYFFKNPYFNYIENNKKHVFGWPFWPETGGTCLDDIRFSYKNYEQYLISDRDKHPSALGQELFAGILLEHYRKIYG